MENKFEVEVFADDNGKEPFRDWINYLDNSIQERLLTRINRMVFGNFGDYKNLGSGIFELRFDFGGGYRIYFGKKNHKLVILLCGGDKKTQNQDIKKATQYWQTYEQRTK